MILAIQMWIMNKEVIKELGEPLIYLDGDIWIVNKKGFGCINAEKIRYLFVDKKFRNLGIGSIILKELEKHCCNYELLAPKSVIQFYLKHGYKAEKFTVNWVKLYK
jgi:GNAT superfamily N-acetyltransferase